ncbi:hypothetical protein ZWY2020_022521 [Hordeum vulgare]|nr:hypothetical protein ZWY2020_022521 [Hordeum vulgare]
MSDWSECPSWGRSGTCSCPGLPDEGVRAGGAVLRRAPASASAAATTSSEFAVGEAVLPALEPAVSAQEAGMRTGHRQGAHDNKLTYALIV